LKGFYAQGPLRSAEIQPAAERREPSLWREARGLRDIEQISPSGKEAVMALTRGSFQGYEFDRMVILFSMIDGDTEIPCAVSTSALDALESASRSKANEREAQFMRLRDRIEERADRKFQAMEFEGTPPSIILRGIDFRS
jgi:hypothetical protein